MAWPVYIEGEVAAGSVDGFNQNFKTATDYVPGSLVVYRNGQAGAQNDVEYGWTEMGGRDFKLDVAPLLLDVIQVGYRPL